MADKIDLDALLAATAPATQGASGKVDLDALLAAPSAPSAALAPAPQQAPVSESSWLGTDYADLPSVDTAKIEGNKNAGLFDEIVSRAGLPGTVESFFQSEESTKKDIAEYEAKTGRHYYTKDELATLDPGQAELIDKSQSGIVSNLASGFGNLVTGLVKAPYLATTALLKAGEKGTAGTEDLLGGVAGSIKEIAKTTTGGVSDIVKGSVKSFQETVTDPTDTLLNDPLGLLMNASIVAGGVGTGLRAAAKGGAKEGAKQAAIQIAKDVSGLPLQGLNLGVDAGLTKAALAEGDALANPVAALGQKALEYTPKALNTFLDPRAGLDAGLVAKIDEAKMSRDIGVKDVKAPMPEAPKVASQLNLFDEAKIEADATSKPIQSASIDEVEAAQKQYLKDKKKNLLDDIKASGDENVSDVKKSGFLEVPEHPGTFVSRPLYNYLKATDSITIPPAAWRKFPEAVRAGFGRFKIGYNPGSWLNAGVSNMVMAAAEGGVLRGPTSFAQDLGSLWLNGNKSLVKKDKFYASAQKLGLIEDTLSGMDAKSLKVNEDALNGMFDGKFNAAKKVIIKTGQALAKGDDFAMQKFGAIDGAAKFSIWKRAIQDMAKSEGLNAVDIVNDFAENGLTAKNQKVIENSLKYVKKWYPDYTTASPLLADADKLGALPFSRYAYQFARRGFALPFANGSREYARWAATSEKNRDTLQSKEDAKLYNQLPEYTEGQAIPQGKSKLDPSKQSYTNLKSFNPFPQTPLPSQIGDPIKALLRNESPDFKPLATSSPIVAAPLALAGYDPRTMQKLNPFADTLSKRSRSGQLAAATLPGFLTKAIDLAENTTAAEQKDVAHMLAKYVGLDTKEFDPTMQKKIQEMQLQELEKQAKAEHKAALKQAGNDAALRIKANQLFQENMRDIAAKRRKQ